MAAPEFRIEADADAAARACARVLADADGHVVLTGGSTPGRAYELAAAVRRDWSGTTVWWGDDRAVPPDHEHSNYGMAKRALLDRLPVGPDAVHRIRGELGAARAADEYDEQLAGVSLDLVLLGLGRDGHVASLFPNEPTLASRSRRAIAAQARLEPFVDRVTMTITVLESAPRVVYLVAGAEKADAAARAFLGPPDFGTPGSLVRSKKGETLAILDLEAAAALGL